MVKKSKPTQNKPRPKRSHLSREVQDRLSAFVNSSTEGFALLDENLNYMFINPVAERMIGVSKEAVVGKNALDVVPDIKESGRYDRYLEVLKTGEPFQIEDMVSHTKFGDIHASLKAFRVESWLGLVFTDITERKRVEEALRRSEEYFRALIENAQDAIVILNGDGTMRYGSPSIERIWGYEVEDWSNKNFSEFVSPDDMQNAAEAFARLLRNPGSRIYTEMHIRHKDGSIHVIEALGKNLMNDSSINGIVVNVRDITGRKKAEEMLRESEVRFRQLFENMSTGVAVYEAINEGEDFIIKDFNKAGERIDKVERRYVIGKSVLEVFSGVKDFGLFDVFRRVWRTENPEHHPVSLYKDGRIMGWRENYVYKLPSGEIVAIYDDVTERKQAEGVLRESEEKYRNLFNTAEVALFRSRIADGKILECNDLLAKLFGYDSREQCMNEHVTSEHYVDHSVRPQILTQMLERGEVRNFEALVTRRDGSPFWMSYSAHIYPERDYLEGVVIDITERKRMEEALRESEQTIRRLAKAAASAHEEERHRVSLEVHDRISQILTAAFHQLQALETIPIENAEAQQILKRASALLQESIRESRSIMEDLYSPVLSDFGIAAVIDEELRRFQEETGCRTKFDKRCTVRPTPDVELTTYRIFHEALNNVKRHAIGASEVNVFLSYEADMVSLQVKDNGPGFDAEAAMQNKRVGGLKGMQRRAELGGGTFEVASTPEKGTMVTVRLPYASETSAPDAEKEEKTT